MTFLDNKTINAQHVIVFFRILRATIVLYSIERIYMRIMFLIEEPA